MDIQVSGRKIIVPFMYQIGVQNDNAVEKLNFVFDRYTSAGVDLSLGIGYVLFQLKNGTLGHVVANPVVLEDDETKCCMTLEVGSQLTEQTGSLKLALRVAGLDDCLWSTVPAEFYIASTINVAVEQPISFMRAMVLTEEPVTPMLLDPDQEPPLTVSERTIQIPSELQTIAVANDIDSEAVKIIVPRYYDGVDLSQYDFILHTEMAGNGTDDILFNNTLEQMKDIKETTVELTWVLRPPQTSYAGTLSIQLLVTGGEDFKWHSLIATLTVAEHLSGEPIIPVAPSIYEAWLTEIQGLRDETKGYRNESETFKAQVAASEAAAKASELSAEEDAASASQDAASASSSASSALQSKTSAASSAIESQSWAVGGTGTRPGEDTENAKYYYERAAASTDIPAHNNDPEAHQSIQAKVSTLWDAVFTDITTNPFVIVFTSLEGITVTAGVYNVAKSRLECGAALSALELHNIDAYAHQTVGVDGNMNTLADTTITLEDHKENPEAHQNLIIDGNTQ